MSTQSQLDYEHRSEILSHGLRRDVWQSIGIALDQAGQVSLAQDIWEFLESKEAEQ